MTKVALNYPAPIPVGHRVELTWFEDARPAKRRDRVEWSAPHARPVVRDLETGIRYMNHSHASIGSNGGQVFAPRDMPFAPRPELAVREVWTARVTACTLVYLEGFPAQHTMLDIEPIDEG
ncbi:hypothetical protein [Microbacterium sp. gxy059]|uniref:hypothetical protein n=1 Tax=Microbacterium sp. gxy059 TaxID=2957199 RepID=UPI003D96A354